jgi:hypothetical protein
MLDNFLLRSQLAEAGAVKDQGAGLFVRMEGVNLEEHSVVVSSWMFRIDAALEPQ